MDFFKVAMDIERMVENHYCNLTDECSKDKGIQNKITILADDHKKHRISSEQIGKHDQGWKERLIFGKVRYMNAKELERKFAIKKYVQQIEKIEKQQRG